MNHIGPRHFDTLIAKENLALTYIEIDDAHFAKAYNIMNEVLDVRTRRLGEKYPYTLLAMLNLGKVKGALQDFESAEELIRKALAMAEIKLGAGHFGTLSGWSHLSKVLIDQGKSVEAEEILLKVIQQHKYRAASSHDGEHPDRCAALYNLVLAYQSQKKYDHGLLTCDELLNALKIIRGSEEAANTEFPRRIKMRISELQKAKEAEMGQRATISPKSSNVQ